MREHLYRGFHPDENGATTITLDGKKIKGKWVVGYYVEATRHWHKYGIHKSWIVTSAFQNGGYFNIMGRYAVVPETVSEFIGKTDRNGKEIFESDIVEVEWFDGDCDKIRSYGVVEYDSICAFYHIHLREYCSYVSIANHPEIRVVGNIYDSQNC